MTAPSKQDAKDRTPPNKDVQELDAEELQDRIVHLRDQERQVQREIAERRELEALASSRRERERLERRRQQQIDAYQVVDRQARDGFGELEDGSRRIARGVAQSLSALVPPVLRQPTLAVDIVFNTMIVALSFQRDFINGVLTTSVVTDAQ